MPSWTDTAPTHKTSTNRFGIFKQFFGPLFPAHDPDIHASFQELCDGPLVKDNPPDNEAGQLPSLQDISTIGSPNMFYPYANENSFKLAEWWNQGVLNSMDRFKELIKIVGSPSFQSSDIAATS